MRLQNGNKFKLGLFGMNCSANVATTAAECWQAGWDETVAAARLADAAGIEFIGTPDDYPGVRIKTK